MLPTGRAQESARTNQARVQKLKELVKYEALEASQLCEFLEQERYALLDQLAAADGQLTQERAAGSRTHSALLATVSRADDAEQQLNAATGEVGDWFS